MATKRITFDLTVDFSYNAEDITKDELPYKLLEAAKYINALMKKNLNGVWHEAVLIGKAELTVAPDDLFSDEA